MHFDSVNYWKRKTPERQISYARPYTSSPSNSTFINNTFRQKNKMLINCTVFFKNKTNLLKFPDGKNNDSEQKWKTKRHSYTPVTRVQNEPLFLQRSKVTRRDVPSTRTMEFYQQQKGPEPLGQVTWTRLRIITRNKETRPKTPSAHCLVLFMERPGKCKLKEQKAERWVPEGGDRQRGGEGWGVDDKGAWRRFPGLMDL